VFPVGSELKQHRQVDSAVLLKEVLLPAKGLAQNPERCRNGNEEQAQTNWATPTEP